MNTNRAIQKFYPYVTEIKDATKALTISVTKHDESTSKKRNYSECAMALACKRALKLDGVLMARSVAYLVKGNVATRYGVPPSVGREVVSFDRGGGFAPGEYALSKPTKKHGSGNGAAPKGTKHGHGPFRHITTGIRAVLGGKDAKV